MLILPELRERPRAAPTDCEFKRRENPFRRSSIHRLDANRTAKPQPQPQPRDRIELLLMVLQGSRDLAGIIPEPGKVSAGISTASLSRRSGGLRLRGVMEGFSA